MKIFRVAMLCLACMGWLFAAATNKDADQTQKMILEEFDIDAKFLKSSHYASIKNSIKDGKRKEFARTVKNGYKHIPVLQKIIKESGIPESFLYLAMTESGFSNHIVSKKKAIGIWQFMESTAKLYGLRVDKYTDERKDPVAATAAATKYLQSLKNDFGKWYLAMMAYNCGEARLRAGIRKAGTTDLAALLDDKKSYIPKETKRFVKKILTTAHIAKEQDDLLAKTQALSGTNGIELSKINVPGGTTLMEVGDSIGLSLKKMKEYNMHLKFVYTPPTEKPYYLYIPANKTKMFSDNFEVAQNRKFEIYTVKENDTILSIAEKNGRKSQNHKRIQRSCFKRDQA